MKSLKLLHCEVSVAPVSKESAKPRLLAAWNTNFDGLLPLTGRNHSLGPIVERQKLKDIDAALRISESDFEAIMEEG
jgi:hypothetical protein